MSNSTFDESIKDDAPNVEAPLPPPKPKAPVTDYEEQEEEFEEEEFEMEDIDHAEVMQLVYEDVNEFNEFDFDLMPKSRFKDKSFIKLREFYDTIVSDLDHAERIGIPLDDIKDEFHFVWNAIQKSHQNLEDLLRKDVAISVNLGDTMAKTRNLIRIAEDQPEVALRLGRRLETAWNLVDISEEEEKRNSQKLEELETEITFLNRNISTAASMEGRSELTELQKIKRKLVDERELVQKEINRMRSSLSILNEKKHRQIDRKAEFQEAIKYADEEAIAQNEALTREQGRKEKIEKSVLETTQQIEVKTTELEEIEKKMSAANSKINSIERNIRDQKVINDMAMKDAEQAMTKQDKMRMDVDAQIALVERLALDAHKRQLELKGKEDEIIAAKVEESRAERQKLLNQKKCDVLQEKLDYLEVERENLKAKIGELERDLERAQKRLEESKRAVEELDKQRTAVNRNLQRANALASEHEHNIKLNAIALNNLEGELEGFTREIGSQSSTIRRLEKERDFYSHEAVKLGQLVTSRIDDIKILDMSIYEHKKQVADLEAGLKFQMQFYEAAIVEKQYYERLFRETVAEISSTSKDIRNAKFEKSGLHFKETDLRNAILAEEERRDYLEREAEFLKTEAARIRHMAVDIQRETEALEVERSTLGCAIAEAENEIGKQRYYATSGESRMENYQRKMMLKEKELRDTWEKWRTLHSMVRIGAYHYRNLGKEVRIIRQQMIGLRQLQLSFKGNTNHIVQLQQEISALENCISKETCMVNALEDELSRSINIHRWRVLEAIDPEAYSMVKKINIVTKRLVDHNETIRQQNLRIKDKENTYVDIKAVLRKLPGLETPEEKRYYEVLYDAKKNQLATLRQEIYSNEAQTQFYRKQVIQLDNRLEELRQEYFKKMDAQFCLRSQNKLDSCRRKRSNKRQSLMKDILTVPEIVFTEGSDEIVEAQPSEYSLLPEDDENNEEVEEEGEEEAEEGDDEESAVQSELTEATADEPKESAAADEAPSGATLQVEAEE